MIEASFQICVRDSDQKLLNFLYRNPEHDMTDEIELLIFEVLTMGIPSDSFELELCLRKIAGLENGDNPMIVNAILRIIYADDVISYFDSEKKAIIFFKLIVKVIANHGFLLLKFVILTW